MSLVVAAVVLVSAIAVVNLLVWLGIVRRLRKQTTQLEDLSGGDAGGRFEVMVAPGETVPDFSVSTVDGEVLTRAGFTATTLVGVVSPTCAACIEKLPEFVEYAAGHPGGRDHVLAVVVSDDSDSAAPMVTELSGVARVAQQPHDSSIIAALDVHAYPAFGLIGPGGVVRASSLSVATFSAIGVR